MDNFSKGWVASHRSLKNHWLNDRDDYYRWWDIMIKTVNHSEYKFILGDDVYNVGRGQSALSKVNWRELLSNRNYTIGRKRFETFLKLLVKDDMITIKTIGKGNLSSSLITITNYGLYQDEGDSRRTVDEHKTNIRRTQEVQQLNNDNNENKDKQKEEKQRFDFEYQSQNEIDFLNDWFEVRTEIKKGKTFKIHRLIGTETKENFQIIAAGYSRDEIKLGLRGLFRQETFPNNQDLTTDPTHFLKDEGKYISKYIQATNEQNKNIWGTNK